MCLTTRAIHLELVTNLSTEAFMASLDWFISRRGKCSDIYSDNGTNLVGAQKVLKTFLGDKAVPDQLANKEINWHFIPPAAPHFGGLWEAAVKSAKTHLTKLAANALLTFEEASTLLCRIEAVLN